MLRGALVLSGALTCACGRIGFDSGAPSNELGKPDAAPVIDGDPTIDAPIGMGSYAIVEAMAPYISLDGAPVVPGFEPGTDEGVYDVALPFPFTYYGVTYTKIAAHMNGYASFGAPAGAPETYENDCPLDASAPDAMIAVFWDDLFASNVTMPFGTLRSAVAGSAPDRAVVIEWHDVDAYYHAGTDNNFFSQGIRIDHELILHESGVIDLHYGPRTGSSSPKDCGTQRHTGCSATIGLRAPSSAVLQMVQCGTADAGFTAGATPIVDGRVIRFTPR